MIFLLVYDTSATQLVEIKEYDERSRSQAMTDLRNMQEALLGDLDHVEVALFEAESRSMLEQTHSRYFKSLKELGEGFAPERQRSA